MNIDEYESEPIPGLPERLPEGERILWQGAPRWSVLARRAFHVRSLAIYFSALLVLRALSGLWDGLSLQAAVASGLWLMPLALAGLGVLAFLAWLSSRTTLYTITNRRVVMRFGIALPMTVNLPFRVVQTAAVKTYADGTGDIPLTLNTDDRIAYLHMWPHVRAWKIRHPQPMLRAVPEATQAAEVLARALAAFAGTAPLRTADARELAISPSSAPQPLSPMAS